MSNLFNNPITLALAAADVAVIEANASATIAKLPTNATLTEDDRKGGNNDIDVQNKQFVEDTKAELTINGAAIMPGWFPLSRVAENIAFFTTADALESQYQNIVTRLSDAKRIAGRQAYAAALKAYAQYQSAAAAGVPGAQESYNKLRERFEKLGDNKGPQDNP